MGKKVPAVPEELSEEGQKRLMIWARANAPYFATAERIRYVADETLDYHRARGNPAGYSKWLAVVRNRIRSLEGRGLTEFARPRRVNERPQEGRSGLNQPGLLADVIEIGRRR